VLAPFPVSGPFWAVDPDQRAFPFIIGLQEIEWVFLATSERWKHACEHLEPQIFLVA
jgi:hypothetical protein